MESIFFFGMRAAIFLFTPHSVEKEALEKVWPFLPFVLATFFVWYNTVELEVRPRHFKWRIVGNTLLVFSCLTWFWIYNAFFWRDKYHTLNPPHVDPDITIETTPD